MADLIVGIHGRAGWISPEGIIYTLPDTHGYVHRAIEEAIIRDIFGLNPDDFPNYAISDDEISSPRFLWDKGWVRLDLEDIYPIEDLTFEQLVTLRKLQRDPDLINPDIITKVLIANGQSD